MERFTALGRGAQIMLVAGVLLLIDSFFDWQAVSDFPGVNAWDDLGGLLMALLTIVLVAWLGLRIAGVDIKLPVSGAMIGAALAALILLLAIIKNLADDYSTIWAWLGMAFAAAIAVGAWLEVQATGGIEKLKAEMPSMPSSSSDTAAATAPPTAPSPPAPPPPAPAPAAPEAASPPETSAPAEAAGESEGSTDREA